MGKAFSLPHTELVLVLSREASDLLLGLNLGVPTLSRNVDEAHRRAEALFKKEQQVRDGQQATADYQAELRAMQEKTARLRALPLARDAANKNSALVKRKGMAASRPRKHLFHRGG